MKIEKIDENFLESNCLRSAGVTVYNVLEEPFEICGVIPPQFEGDVFHRLSHEVEHKLNEHLVQISHHTSGGKIKFRTNSNYIGVYAELNSVSNFNHMSAIGFMGMDLYAREDAGEYRHVYTFAPSSRENCIISKGMEFADYYDECPEHLYDKSLTVWPVEAGKNKMRDILLNLPLYSGVSKIYVILSEGAVVKKGTPFANKFPIVIYGNSVTQGACASRPGLSWTNLLAQRNNLDIINLGFSGRCKGEAEMAEYLSGIDASVLISDYDWNSADERDLCTNLKRMLDIIRAKKPDLPILCLSRPLFMERQTSVRRRRAIEETVLERINSGDRKIWFIDGSEVGKIFDAQDAITVEGWHLNDIGMFCEATMVEKVLVDVLKNS